MKKLLFLILINLVAINFVKAQNCGCPEEFEVLPDKFACPPKQDSVFTGGNPDINHTKCDFLACKNSKNTYSVWPKKPGFTYNWVVVGGTPNTLVGNSIKVLWDNGSGLNQIKVFIASTDGKCKDTVTQKFCLIDGPKANYTIDGPTTVCLNTGVNFNNTSIGATTAYWNFGDGTTSTQLNPTHAFTAPGTYQVVLTVTNEQINPIFNGGTTGIEFLDKCGCTDTIVKTIIVKNAEPIKIVEGCKKMLCKGDTAEYCTPTACNDYDWSVTGGTILGAKNGKCIKVVWNGSYPATVNLKGNCGAICGNTASMDVPVLFPTMPITGNVKVCPNTKHIYTLSNMPGVFYTWKIMPTSGGTFVGPNLNVSTVNIDWGATTGTYKVVCDYYNPATKCSGKAELNVEVLPEYKVTGPNPTCVNNNAIYTATGPSPSSWTISPNTGFTTSSSLSSSGSLNIHWTKKGTYTITGTPTNPALYCISPASIKVIVNDTPYVNSITGPLLVCPGSTQLYTANSTLSGGNFFWTPTGSSSSIAMGLQKEKISIDWAATGPYKIKVYHTVSGCKSSDKEIILNAYTKPKITGPTPACMDNSATYSTTTPAPAGGYTWSLGNALGTITSGNGTNSITVQWHGSTAPPPNICPVYLTTCGGKDTLNVTITQAPPVTITKSGTLCSTTGITLFSSIAGASTYVWTYNGTTLAPPKNTQNINVTADGTYTVTITQGGCVSKGTIVIPKETPTFNVGISTTSKTYWKCNETINTIMTVTPSSGYCYKWFTKPVGVPGPGSPIAGETLPTYTATSTGLFWCEVSLCSTYCSKATTPIKVESEVCGNPGPCTDYAITSFTKTGTCNPFTFNITTSPTAASSTVHWYFGDGTDEWGGNNIEHTFKTIGTFKVCARVGVSPYCGKDTCMDVAVNIAANFSMINNCGVISLTNLSQTLSGTLNYTWVATGGTFAPSNKATNPTVTFATGGLHDIYLTASIPGGCSVTLKDTISTKAINGILNIPPTICVGTAAPFTVTGTSPGLQYLWNFGDGYTSNLQSTTHAYSSAGLKPVTLTITDPATGCTKVLSQNANVITPQPMATIADKKMCMGSSVVLTAPSYTNATFQWFLEGVAIPGAITATYSTTMIGEYYLQIKIGDGCVLNSNKFKVKYFGASVANIIKDDDEYCDKNNIKLSATSGQGKYTWSQLSGPGTLTFTPNNTTAAFNTVGTATTEGIYQIVLSTLDSNGCKGYDTICIEINKSISVSINSPAGTLCEGKIFTFTAVPSPATSPDVYSYLWSGSSTNTATMTTGVPGVYQVILVDDKGCFATATTPAIAAYPNVSLFPQGCDTLCLTDTIKFPLPLGGGTNASGYIITWYDTDGMTVTNVGTGFTLPAATLNTGDHHLYAEVTYAGGCMATTAMFNLFIKDCTLGPPCNDCPTILDSSFIEMEKELQQGKDFVVRNGSITFTTKVPLKSVKINLSELNYHWKDPACKNCKINTISRGCIFPKTAGQTIGSLTLDNYSGANITTASKECPNELVWKGDTELPAGAYTVPFMITMPEGTDKKKCKLILDNVCVQLTLIDEKCKACITKLCYNGKDDDNNDCNCNPSGNWQSLYLLPVKPGIPKPKNQILCGTTLTDYNLNVPYKLSGQYFCAGANCVSTKNEIVVQDQQTHIVYTRQTAVLNETLTFPGYGYYTVTLTAYCGKKKCVCSFKIFITKKDDEDIPDPKPPVDKPKEDIKNAIDSIVNKELPPNFNGGILVTKNDTVLYEKYVNAKDDVNSHTAFDIASITKTFTSMAVLKLMETGKLKLEDPVKKHLIDFPKSDVTIKMLLTHTSGIEDYLKFMDESNYDRNKIMSNADLYSFIKDNPNKVFVKNAGAAFDYSNTNFALLSLLIENVADTPYMAYMQKTFFKPLKMDDTYVLSADNLQRRKATYYKSGKAYPVRYLDLINGDKCIYTTVQDLRKWDKGLRTLFSKSTIDMAYSSASSLPNTSNYALGWKTIKTSSGLNVWYHLGWWAGNRSMFIRLPKSNVMIAVMSNNNHTSIAELRKIVDLFGDYRLGNMPMAGF